MTSEKTVSPATDSPRATTAASGRSGSRHSRLERAVARVLVAALVGTHPLSASAGDEFGDANNTTFDQGAVQLDNTQAGRTTFTIDTNRTTIGWQDLQQPENNRLEFNFTNGGPRSSVLNYSESINPIRISGHVVSNGTVGFANQTGVYVDGTAVIDVGSLVAIAGSLSRDAFQKGGSIEIPLTGRIENHGLVRADQNVALIATSVLNAGEILAGDGNVLMIGGERVDLADFDVLRLGLTSGPGLRADLTGGEVVNAGRIEATNATIAGEHVVNLGEITIDDGSLLMVGADAVYLRRFDDPVLIRLPKGSVGTSGGTDGSATTGAPARYAIENQGRIEAGRGHVRLAAADPLGFSIRQGAGGAGGAGGSGGAGAPARIAARKIELEGGEDGRVQLSGELDASDRSKKGRGGQIDVTGSIIALVDADLDASGTRAGGQIRVGGEELGGGDLQRARAVLVDEDSEIRADATSRGDGGRIIVFSEDLTSVQGEISARGGAKGGNGGFVETSGLARFDIATAPDVSARRGRSGSWLIDPYDITIQNGRPECATPRAVTCLDAAIDAILDPDFDSAGFDGILRTNGGSTNYISADLIERALGIGTNVTLSTQAFGDDPINGAGDITIVDAISINSLAILEGKVARLTLLAAGNIFVNANIEVLPIGAGPNQRSNLALSVSLQANDASQTKAGRDFALDLVQGDVEINADITTGGGSLSASGISIRQAAGSEIVTRGGDVTLTSGTVSPARVPFDVSRKAGTPTLDDDEDANPATDPTNTNGLTSIDPVLELLGLVDTRTADGRKDGGRVVLTASSANAGTLTSGKDPIEVVTGLLRVAGDVFTGGANVILSGGVTADSAAPEFAGDVELTGTIDSDGGDVLVRANRVNPDVNSKDFTITMVAPASDPTRGEGGAISIDGTIRTAGGILSIGNDTAQSIALDGVFDTTSSNPRENGFVQLIARDSTAIDSDNGGYGEGRIDVGTNGSTSISTAGLAMRTRDVTTGTASGANAVDVELVGRSSSLFFDVTLDTDPNNDDRTVDAPANGVLDVQARHTAFLNRNTEISADTVRLTVAENPLELADDERANSETRVGFGGTNGGGSTASDGVRINANELHLAIGDDSTPTSNLFADDLGTPGDPTDLALQRQTRGAYQGLQLRDRAGVLRPEVVEIRQDGDLTITQGAATADGELDLAGAFGSALIGLQGLQLSLESSDGVIRVDDAAGFNDNAGPLGPGDAGKSFVSLFGGLLLPASPGGTNPDPESVPSPNSVVFRDGVAELGDDGTTAFRVESLTISTPGDLSITQQLASGIAAVADLLFESGRDTEIDGVAGRGTMTIAANTSLAASNSLKLQAGHSGFGDLVFAGTGIGLASNEIEVSAGSTTTSRNADSADLSTIIGLRSQAVTLRDATGAVFGDATSTATAFRYRQTAGIDAAVDLPALAQFGLTDVGPGAGFRTAGDVEFGVRSDGGSIDLDDGVAGTNEADAFRNASLSLVGLQSGSVAAIVVSADTLFTGRSVELGGVSGFTFGGALARAFNRSGTDAGESLTLRAGLGTPGRLEFSADGGSPVLVKAPTIRLISGDGPGDDSGSTIDTRNASFDLSGPVGAARTFAWQMDGNFRVQDLPGVDAFVGGAAGLPNVLAIRNDAGRITIDDFDAAELPIAIATDPSRLVIEAETIELNQKDGDDLELTTNPNLFLRLRANVLNLFAFVSNDRDTESGRVRMGPRPSDTQRTVGTDADFDGESLLVEAFDLDQDLVTTGNLSGVSEEPDDSGLYDLAAGRGPTTISLSQDGSVLASDLADRRSFSGLLARTIVDDDEDQAIPTVYTITSQLGTVTLEPEKVNGSSLFVNGVAANPSDGAIDFAPGSGASPGLYLLNTLDARTEQSIVVRAGTRLVATDALSLAAGLVEQPKDPVTGPLGSIRFAGSHTDGNVTRLESNTISLTAGPAFALTNPDGNDKGNDRDDIDPAFLPKLDLSGLDEVAVVGDLETSALRLRQNASFDVVRGGAGDILTGLEAGAAQAGAGGDEWNELELVSLQGELRLSEIGLFADESSQLIARTGTGDASRIVVDMPNQADRAAPFDDFAQGVRLVSNDIKFRSSDPATSINLATDKLELVSQALALPAVSIAANTGFSTPTITSTGNLGTTLSTNAGRLRRDLDDDPDVVLRPIVRIEQAADFTNSELPRPSQYSTLSLDGTSSRSSLAALDIELTTTTLGTTLTFDDAIRARTTGSNLILRSAGDVVFSLVGLTPGYEDILDENGDPAYAALQLTSLDVEARGGTGTISIAPFTIDAAIADLTLDTFGDQRFAGRLSLQNGLVTSGRDIEFDGDVAQSGAPDAGLVVETNGRVHFAGNVGSAIDRLARLRIQFDGDSGDGKNEQTPSVEFGRRVDLDGDGIEETPIASNQTVYVRDDVEIEALRENADGTALVPGRKRPANFATIAKALGDLTFDSLAGSFEAAAGEKIAVGGTFTINTPAAGAFFSDVSALTFRVFTFFLGFLPRDSGVNFDRKGQTHSDGGASIAANVLELNYLVSVTPAGTRSTRFGVPDPFAIGTDFRFPVFGLRPDGRLLTTADFRFTDTTGELAERVAFVVPTGPSRSDLSGAFGPVRVPTSRTEVADPKRLADPERLRALAVESRPTPDDVVLARLAGAAVIDDRELAPRDGSTTAIVSEARLDATDAEAAIALYAKLFGADDERAPQVRRVLQEALDQYLETHRAQRVVGFELRRFVKNRPSTLIEAYTTLEDLDALFRYHRRLGLSPGEFKRIQLGWLEKIQPDGISVEELSETVHPSRYVRGSDILDIFGQ